MAGVTNRVQLRKGLHDWVREMSKELDADIQESALKAAIAGEDAIRQTIDTTPSDLSRIPKDNRNYTGHMRSLVDTKLTPKKDMVVIQVGWLRLGADDQYILVQEQGGSVQGKIISAMNSMTNAEQAMRRQLQQDGFR